MLERYGCNRNVTLPRASCVLCPISATPRWSLDRSYLAHKRMPHGLYHHRPCATVLALGPILACASVILRTGLQPSTLRERCRGLDAVSFGEVLQHAEGTQQGRADLGLQLRLAWRYTSFYMANLATSSAMDPDAHQPAPTITHCAQVMGAL